MYLDWVVLVDGDSKEWIHCSKFRGKDDQMMPYVIIHNDHSLYNLKGGLAAQFWHQLYLAMQRGERIINLHLQPESAKEIEVMDIHSLVLEDNRNQELLRKYIRKAEKNFLEQNTGKNSYYNVDSSRSAGQKVSA